jgi:hypothetical protein
MLQFGDQPLELCDFSCMVDFKPWASMHPARASFIWIQQSLVVAPQISQHLHSQAGSLRPSLTHLVPVRPTAYQIDSLALASRVRLNPEACILCLEAGYSVFIHHIPRGCHRCPALGNQRDQRDHLIRDHSGWVLGYQSDRIPEKRNSPLEEGGFRNLARPHGAIGNGIITIIRNIDIDRLGKLGIPVRRIFPAMILVSFEAHYSRSTGL